jgi:hypothetical protein
VTSTRRELLWTAARLGAGGTLLLTLGGCGSEASCNEVEIRLSSLLGARALPIGDAYLRMHPEERSGDVLVAALLGDAAGVPADATLIVVDRIRSDFERGRVVDLHGWRLSRSECRLAALAALCAASSAGPRAR